MRCISALCQSHPHLPQQGRGQQHAPLRRIRSCTDLAPNHCTPASIAMLPSLISMIRCFGRRQTQRPWKGKFRRCKDESKGRGCSEHKLCLQLHMLQITPARSRGGTARSMRSLLRRHSPINTPSDHLTRSLLISTPPHPFPSSPNLQRTLRGQSRSCRT